MKNRVTVTLSKKEYQALLILNKRYWFGFFKSIRSNEDEEYMLRDSLASISKNIEEKL